MIQYTKLQYNDILYCIYTVYIIQYMNIEYIMHIFTVYLYYHTADIRKKTMPLAPEAEDSLFIVPQVIE